MNKNQKKQLQEIEDRALRCMDLADEVQKQYANRGEEIKACLDLIQVILTLIAALSVAMQGDRKK